jgi:hypothetical protein
MRIDLIYSSINVANKPRLQREATMLQTLLIAFREGLEALLIVAIAAAAAQWVSALMVALPSIWLVGAFWKDRRRALPSGRQP